MSNFQVISSIIFNLLTGIKKNCIRNPNFSKNTPKEQFKLKYLIPKVCMHVSNDNQGRLQGLCNVPFKRNDCIGSNVNFVALIR